MGHNREPVQPDNTWRLSRLIVVPSSSPSATMASFPVAPPMIVLERVIFPGPEVMAHGRQPQQNNGNAPDFDETPRPVEMAGDDQDVAANVLLARGRQPIGASALDQLDKLVNERGLQDVTFTAVGYGLQESFPDQASFLEHNQKIRMVAYPQLLQINTGFTGDGSLLLQRLPRALVWRGRLGETCTGVYREGSYVVSLVHHAVL